MILCKVDVALIIMENDIFISYFDTFALLVREKITKNEMIFFFFFFHL